MLHMIKDLLVIFKSYISFLIQIFIPQTYKQANNLHLSNIWNNTRLFASWYKRYFNTQLVHNIFYLIIEVCTPTGNDCNMRKILQNSRMYANCRWWYGQYKTFNKWSYMKIVSTKFFITNSNLRKQKPLLYWILSKSAYPYNILVPLLTYQVNGWSFYLCTLKVLHLRPVDNMWIWPKLFLKNTYRILKKLFFR